jgi:RNA polymerase sigma-70 factor (ECF subfamily)
MRKSPEKADIWVWRDESGSYGPPCLPVHPPAEGTKWSWNPSNARRRARLQSCWSGFEGGDREAEAQLIPLVYTELRRVASLCLNRERGDHTLQPTALVHEVFLRLTNNDQPQWQNRAHFFGVAARLMRQILVDYARRHRTRKRGGELEKLPLDEALAFTPDKSTELIMLDQALERLSEVDERQARIVEMKFFGGLSMEEIAGVLDISTKTASRDWTMARAWLHREIAG